MAHTNFRIIAVGGVRKVAMPIDRRTFMHATLSLKAISRMASNHAFATFLLAAIWVVSLPGIALAQSQISLTETQVWPEGDIHWLLPSQLRVLAFGGVEQGVDYPYQQWYLGAALGYQFKPILRPHIENIDPDKEHYFVFGAGYEYLRTIQSGIEKHEDRITIEGTPGFRLPHEFLVRDRNWIELRWIDGRYLTTYRNMLTVEHDLLLRGFHFLPYGSAEVWYDGSKHSWNTKWYTAGIEWPYKRIFMIDTYYRRENCQTCTPAYWNVAGFTMNFYLGRQSSR